MSGVCIETALIYNCTRDLLFFYSQIFASCDDLFLSVSPNDARSVTIKEQQQTVCLHWQSAQFKQFVLGAGLQLFKSLSKCVLLQKILSQYEN